MINFEVIKEGKPGSTEGQSIPNPSLSEIAKVRQENKALLAHVKEETMLLELLSLKLKRIRKMYEHI